MKLKLSAVKKNLVANFFGIGVQLFTRIALVPLFLFFWDTDTYSDWIILTAISSFFAMSDAGLNSVTINRFVIKYAQQDYKECRSLLTNNYILIGLVFLLSMMGSYLYLHIFDITQNLGLHKVSRESANFIFLMLIIYIFAGMASAVLDAIYRASSLNHKGVYIGNIVRLTEGLIITGCLFLNTGITTIVIFYFIPRVLSLIYKIIDTKQYFNYKFSLKYSNWKLFKNIFFPSVTFMSFPLGNAIIFQGFSLVVNKFFGAELLIIYNTTRTLTSFVTQILGTLLQAVWPEFSIAYGKKDIVRMRQLYRKAFVIATSTALGISIFLLIAGNLIFDIWTGGKVEFNFSLMFAFLVVLIFRNVWSTSSVVLMATNKHSKMGIIYVFASISSIGLAIVAAQVIPSLTLLVYCLLILELFLCYYALKRSLEVTEDSFINLYAAFKTIFHEYKGSLQKKLSSI